MIRREADLIISGFVTIGHELFVFALADARFLHHDIARDHRRGSDQRRIRRRHRPLSQCLMDWRAANCGEIHEPKLCIDVHVEPWF